MHTRQHLAEINQLRRLLGTPQPRRRGGIRSAGSGRGAKMEVDKCEIAAERWEKRRRGGKKLFLSGHTETGGENVSEHVLQDRLSGSR